MKSSGIDAQNASRGSICKEDLFGTNTKKEDGKKKKDVKTLDEIVTLKDVDISIKKGEFVCIIGDVGSGKTSIL